MRAVCSCRQSAVRFSEFEPFISCINQFYGAGANFENHVGAVYNNFADIFVGAVYNNFAAIFSRNVQGRQPAKRIVCSKISKIINRVIAVAKSVFKNSPDKTVAYDNIVAFAARNGAR